MQHGMYIFGVYGEKLYMHVKISPRRRNKRWEKKTGDTSDVPIENPTQRLRFKTRTPAECKCSSNCPLRQKEPSP